MVFAFLHDVYVLEPHGNVIAEQHAARQKADQYETELGEEHDKSSLRAVTVKR